VTACTQIGVGKVHLIDSMREQLRSSPVANIIATTMSGGQLLRVPYPEQGP
jgi:hypothetical protein